MSNFREQLINQVSVLNDWLSENCYEDVFTEAKAKQSLEQVKLIWQNLERRTK